MKLNFIIQKSIFFVLFLYTFEMIKRLQRCLLQQAEYEYTICFFCSYFDHTWIRKSTEYSETATNAFFI